MSAAATIEPADLTDEQLLEGLWRAGNTRFVLMDEQTDLWDLVLEGQLPESVKRVCAQWSRRLGKSTTAQAIGDALCRRKEFRNVIHGFPTADTAAKVTRDNARAIYQTCPLHLQPRWRVQGGFFEYPWCGSRYYVRGLETENDIENVLGLAADLIIFDEAGFIRYLKYAIQCYAPMMLGRQGALMLIISSRARDPYHQFYQECDRAAMNGAFLLKNIHSTSRYSPREIQEFAADCGGEESPEWRADYLCERIIDTEFAILPEFATRQETAICEWERPDYFNTFVGMDLGWHPDLTFAVAGYYDFENAKIVIEDEFEISQMTTDALAEEMRAMEQRRFGDYWDKLQLLHPPQIITRYGKVVTVRGPVSHMRTQDVDKQIQADLTVLHNLPINQAYNQDPKSHVNRSRIALREDRLKIHPRCVRLIAHCNAGLWNKQRTSFERVPGFGHFDGVSALVIAVAHCDETTNPFPEVLPQFKRQDVVDLRQPKKAVGPFRVMRRR